MAAATVPTTTQALTAAQVVGYLAKYATKTAADDTTTTTAHHRRLQATVADLHLRAQVATLSTGSRINAYELLEPWAHMLRFRGHFATKFCRYSITLGQLRRTRQRAQARIAASRVSGTPLDLASLEADLLADDEQTTLVIGRWSYLGSGWANDGERAPRYRRRSPRPRIRPTEGPGPKSSAALDERTSSMKRPPIAAAPPPAPTCERLWALSDPSEFLGVPVATIYYWRSLGAGPPGYRVGRHIRFDPDQVRAWLTTQAA